MYVLFLFFACFLSLSHFVCVCCGMYIGFPFLFLVFPFFWIAFPLFCPLFPCLFHLSPQQCLAFCHSLDFRSFILSSSSLPNPFMICLAIFLFLYISILSHAFVPLIITLYIGSEPHQHRVPRSPWLRSLSTSGSATAASPPLSPSHGHGYSHSLGHGYPLGYGHAYGHAHSHSHGGYTTLVPKPATAGVNGTGMRHYLWISAGWIYIGLDLEGGFIPLGAVIGFE